MVSLFQVIGAIPTELTILLFVVMLIMMSLCAHVTLSFNRNRMRMFIRACIIIQAGVVMNTESVTKMAILVTPANMSASMVAPRRFTILPAAGSKNSTIITTWHPLPMATVSSSLILKFTATLECICSLNELKSTYRHSSDFQRPLLHVGTEGFFVIFGDCTLKWSFHDSRIEYEFSSGTCINADDVLGRYKTADEYDMRSEDLARTMQDSLKLRYSEPSHGSPPPSSLVAPSKG